MPEPEEDDLFAGSENEQSGADKYQPNNAFSSMDVLTSSDHAAHQPDSVLD
ncbi:hypothetical protein ACQKM2_39545 [Streptomyces sp. NPDC004126]|uniref:hypothetical protein n=1 Tax=Streptomyces sp. NPDC004126 TaxID=3390695 RepID=UPI003D06E24B